MGNRASISKPMVIQTELRPLDESFWIAGSGQLEQWYYENDNVFAPDRMIVPLHLSPHLSVKDGDTGNSYSTESSPATITFQSVTWKVKEWNGSSYSEATIDSTTSTDPYYISGNELIVNKNHYDGAHAVTITCLVSYNDPRDVGMQGSTQGSVMLTTSVDATAIYPVIDIANPSARSFNPLKDDAIYEFTAVADFPTTARGASGAQCPCDALGTEEVAKGVNSVAPTMTIQYGEGIDSVTQENQTFVRRQTSGGAVSSIHGDVSFIKSVKGNAVSWNQLIQNGDFSDGTTNWFGDEISTSVSGGKMTVTYTQSNGRLRNTISWVVGHKYYACVTATSSTATTIHVELDFGWNQFQTLCQSNTRTFCHGFLNATEQGEFNWLQIFTDEANTITVENVMVIDLTLLFGVGNEPSTVADFEVWLANNIGTRAYYPYNAGELILCNMLGIKTVGFNQWDEEWENGSMDTYAPECTGGKVADGSGYLRCKNYIPIFPNTAYYLKGSDAFNVGFYDANQNYLGYFEGQVGTNSITSPSGAYYMSIQSMNPYNFPYNHDICINISNVSKNGTYEPYKTFTRNIDVTKLYGKNAQGNYVQMFPNGMRSAGSVHDVVDLENATADVNVGARAYLSGDESDSTVITDMTNTFYPLATPIHYTDVVYREGGADTPVSQLFGSFEWYGVNSSGQEVPIDTLPIYTNATQPTSGGQHTERIMINALYDNQIPVILRVKSHPWDANVLPPKVTKSVAWKIPPIDVEVVSDKGSAVRSTHIDGQTADDFTFSTIVNQQGEVISDAKKAANMVFKWYYVKYSQATGQAIIPPTQETPEVYVGEGQTKAISAATLKNTKPVVGENTSTSVFCEAYILGAYHLVNGQYVRTIDE